MMIKNCSLSIDTADRIKEYIEASRSRGLQNPINVRCNIMHQINTRGKLRTDNVVRLNQKELSDDWNISAGQINIAIHDLLYLNLIKITSGYEIGKQSFGYISLDNDYDASQVITLSGTSTVFSEPFQLQESKSFSNTYIKHLLDIKFLFKAFKECKYYYCSYIYNASTAPSNVSVKENSTNIKWLNETHWLSQPYKDNRIYSSITNLSRSYRKFIRWNDEPIHQTDLVASQVVLSYQQFKLDTNQTEPNMEEVLAKGTFYETLMDILEETDRDKIKTRFFKEFMYCSHKSMKGILSDAVKDICPLYWKWVYESKEVLGTSRFAIDLQSTEWQLIRNTLQELFLMGIPALSLHDSIIYPKSVEPLLIESLLQIQSKKMFDTHIPIKSSKL